MFYGFGDYVSRLICYKVIFQLEVDISDLATGSSLRKWHRTVADLPSIVILRFSLVFRGNFKVA